jgi:predicted enzyme related to lactoylglutathione lyase
MHEKINYIELPASNLTATKHFFNSCFDWTFTDYGPEYCAFFNAGLNGGFYQSELSASTSNGSALVVLYSDKLEQTQEKIEQAGGSISKAIFSFPGGRRFHFIEPSGNEFAVWSDQGL